MNRIIFTIIMSLSGLHAMAQDVIVCGTVRDAFDNTAVENASVHILNKDSNIVSVAVTKIPYTTMQSDGASTSYKDKNRGAVFECSLPGHGDYTAMISMIGYEKKRVSFHVPERQRKKLDIGDIYLMPKPLGLGEVSVTATKLKMYHNGDTLVYNADAFVLDKRNVLEDLVKMLPGVELRDGKVFANGRFVESIIISGKDVMPGNPVQLMKMLPAYIVDKLKFYDREGEKSKTMGKDMMDDSYVMDVCLKRDYHASWIGNAEAGGGSGKRWEGLGFVMRFDDRQYFSISGDANNTGIERVASDLCTMETAYDDRDLTNRQMNIDYAYYPTDKLRFDVGGMIRRQDTEMGKEEKQKLFLSDGTYLYKLNGRTTDRVGDYYKGNVSMSLRPRKGMFGKFMYSCEYGKDTEVSKGQSMTALHDINTTDSVWLYAGMPQAVYPYGITNVYTDSVLSSRHIYNHKAGTEWHFAMGGNLMKFKADYKWLRDNGDVSQKYDNRVFDNKGEEEICSNLHETQLEDATATLLLEYDINYIENNMKRGVLMPYYSYSYRKAGDNRLLTLFEPQNDGTELSYTDTDNSREIKETSDVHTLGMQWTHENRLKRKGWLLFNGQLPLQIKNVDARLTRYEESDRACRRYLLVSPSVEMKWHPKTEDRNGNITSLKMKGWCTQTAPKEVYLLRLTDTSDPLNTYFGNPELEKQTDAGLSADFRHYFESNKHNTYATLSGTKRWNAIAMQSVYDKQSGLRTFMPVNAGGEYLLTAEGGYAMPLVSSQTCWLNMSAGANYSRYANMMLDDGSMMPDDSGMMPDDGNGSAPEYIRSLVYRAKAGLRWNDRKRRFEIAYSISYVGNNIVYNEASGENVGELGNSLSFKGHLPADISIGVNCNLVSRFGYSISELNKPMMLAGAQVSKAFFKDKLELRLKAVDIFRQRKHILYSMNGEGHTETVATHYIPAYIMLSVRFNWSYSPKKKKQSQY